MTPIVAPSNLQDALGMLLDACNAKGILAAQIATQEQFVNEQWAGAYQNAYDAERTASGRRDLADAATSIVRRELTRLRGELVAIDARVHYLTVYIQTESRHDG